MHWIWHQNDLSRLRSRVNFNVLVNALLLIVFDDCAASRWAKICLCFSWNFRQNKLNPTQNMVERLSKLVTCYEKKPMHVRKFSHEIFWKRFFWNVFESTFCLNTISVPWDRDRDKSLRDKRDRDQNCVTVELQKRILTKSWKLSKVMTI